jgi:tRNA(adenine34) deaminase
MSSDETNSYWMKYCLELSAKALPEDVPVGCVILNSKGFLVAEAYNQRETKHLVTGHAELIALDQAAQKQNNWRLDDCILFVTLEPCPMCAAAIIQSRIGKLVFGAYDHKVGFWSANNHFKNSSNQSQLSSNHLCVIGGVLEEECSLALKNFFREKR